MSEYWVSKKQYWCKYCNIFVRDDAPSKSLHESGGKHQGNKERAIREIYRSGERAKRDAETHKREIARIEAAAGAAHSKATGHGYAGRPILNRPIASSSRPPRTKGPEDKWANYSSAAQLGFDDEASKISTYEIEQMVRGRGTKVGEWEEVTITPEPVAPEPVPELVDEDDPENFKFKHKEKRPIRDVYDDDEWDAKAILGSLKLKKKETADGAEAEPAEAPTASAPTAGAGWAKIENGENGVKVEDIKADDAVKTEDGVKAEDGVREEASETHVSDPPLKDSAPVKTEPDVKPDPAPSAGLFKKRRPPPSSRKK